MDHQQQDELISAYLDGELSSSEQEQVERLLERDPAARRLHQQLRAVRAQFENLPRHRLTSNVAAEVLKRTSVQKAAAPGSLGLRLLRQPGTWLWPAVAIAAALCILVFQNQREVREVAQGDAGAPPRAAQSAPIDQDAEIGALVEPGRSQAGGFPPASPGGRGSGVSAGADFKDAQTRPARSSGDQAINKKLAEGARGSVSGLSDEGAARAGTRQRQSKLAAAIASQSVIYVNCVVTPEAARQDVLGQVLTRNSVSSLQEAYDAKALQSSDYTSPRKVEKELEIVKQSAAAEHNLVYVEATPAQLKATLEELRRRPAEIVQIDVEPTTVAFDTDDFAVLPGPSAGTSVLATDSSPDSARPEQDGDFSGGSQGPGTGAESKQKSVLPSGRPSELGASAPPSTPANSGARPGIAAGYRSLSDGVSNGAPLAAAKRAGQFGAEPGPAPERRVATAPAAASPAQPPQQNAAVQVQKLSVFFKVEVERQLAKPGSSR